MTDTEKPVKTPTKAEQTLDPWVRRSRKSDAELQEEAYMKNEYYDQWDDEDERR